MDALAVTLRNARVDDLYRWLGEHNDVIVYAEPGARREVSREKARCILDELARRCPHGFDGDCMVCDPEPCEPARDPACDGHVAR